MARYEDIMQVLMDLADATKNDGMIAAMGTPGREVELGGEIIKSGTGINPPPTPFTLMVEAFANYLDDFKTEIMDEVQTLLDAQHDAIIAEVETLIGGP